MEREVDMSNKFRYFSDENSPSLEEVLENREKRVEKIKKLENEFPYNTIICFKLNIPGKQKINEAILKIFSYGTYEIEQILRGSIVLSKEERINKTGPELFLVTDYNPIELKEKMIKLEESSSFGRLYDIDLVKNGENITREMLNSGPRKCFLCEKDAKICARNRSHSVDEMIFWIENLIDEHKEDLWQIEE